jgi:bla regulator protein blaR1
MACSDELQGPVVLGVLHPVLVLPGWFVANSSEADLASALCHELAHIRRHDFLLNLVYEFFLLPISFHPAAWLIKKQIEHTRELACDEIAAENLPTRATYARSLLSIAQSMASTASSARSVYALGLFDANTRS